MVELRIPAAANDAVPTVLAAYLATGDHSAIERGVVTAWASRDPVDAALDAALLYQRFSRPDDVPAGSAGGRRAVDVIEQAWTQRYPPTIRLRAAYRLVQVMNAWADSVIDQAMTADPPFSIANHKE